MAPQTGPAIRFIPLMQVDPAALMAHMRDPRIRQHLPLLAGEWDDAAQAAFLSAKQARWNEDGLGHWAIFADGRYAGWGGFQKEGSEWDFGLVLKPDSFGLGPPIARAAIAFARADARIPFVTFLLPPSRRNLGALGRLGATFVGRVEHAGAPFLKYRLETA